MTNIVITSTTSTITLTCNDLSNVMGGPTFTYNKSAISLIDNTTSVTMQVTGLIVLRFSYNGSANTYQVDSINGAAPISNADLLSKMQAVVSDQGGSGYDGDPATITQDATHRFATDTEKTNWNSKAAGSHNHNADYEPINSNIQTHIGSAHAPSNAQKNSDITKAEIEAKLIGEINTHTHAGGGLSQQQIEGLI